MTIVPASLILAGQLGDQGRVDGRGRWPTSWPMRSSSSPSESESEPQAVRARAVVAMAATARARVRNMGVLSRGCAEAGGGLGTVYGADPATVACVVCVTRR